MQRLKDLREDRDLSEKDIANFLNMSQPGYSKYETSTNNVPIIVLIKLAIYYKTSVDYILGETNELKPHKRDLSTEIKNLCKDK